MYRATRIRFKPWKNWQIRWFIKRYNVNMDEALESDPQHYLEFNTFFTRPYGPMPAHYLKQTPLFARRQTDVF